MRSASLVLPLLFAAACNGADLEGPTGPAFQPVELFADCPAHPPAVDVPSPARDSIALLPVAGSDEYRVVLARTIPGGFGGMWTDSLGRRTIALVDLSQREAAVAALRADPNYGRLTTDDMVVVPARWNFAQLVEWDFYLRSAVIAAGDVVGIDRDESTNRLTYGVRTEVGRDRLIAELHAAGAPCGLVVIEHDTSVDQ
jgi:hypothetical protein